MTDKYPSFIRPTEDIPELDVSQQEHATKVFNQLFDDIMLENMSDVKQFKNIMPVAMLVKKITVDGKQYTVGIQDSEKEVGDRGHYRPSEDSVRKISIQRVSDGKGREYWAYRLGTDGVVRRWDGGDLYAKQQEQTIQDEITDYDVSTRAIQALRRMHDELPNMRMEEDMGLNRRPVEPEELEGLRDFIRSAEQIT